MSNVTHTLTDKEYLITYSVGPNQLGVRLDRFIKERYRRRSRVQIQDAIEEGRILVQRTQGPHVTVGRLKPSSQLIPGDEVMIVTEKKPEPPVSFDYKILFEDEALFVIEKPANLPVHPAGIYFFNTLLTHLKTRGFREPLKGDHDYYLAHRIDKETSGILVLTKTPETCAHITAQFAQRQTEKRYLAVTRGRIEKDEFTVDLAMRRQGNGIIGVKMVPRPEDDGGLPAVTRFKRLEVRGDFTLVECHPKTGRQHQIRVHLDAIGHPIVGDKLYGMPEEEALRFFERERLTPEAEAKLLLPRHALHSAGIRFRHPLTGEMREFRSELPSDLREFLNSQG